MAGAGGVPDVAALEAELAGGAGRLTLLLPGPAPAPGALPPLLAAAAEAGRRLHPRGRCFTWGGLALPGFGRSGRRLKHLVKKLRRVKGLLAVAGDVVPAPSVFCLLARRLGFDLFVVGAAPGVDPRLFSRVIVAPDSPTGLPRSAPPPRGALVFFPAGRGAPQPSRLLPYLATGAGEGAEGPSGDGGAPPLSPWRSAPGPALSPAGLEATPGLPGKATSQHATKDGQAGYRPPPGHVGPLRGAAPRRAPCGEATPLSGKAPAAPTDWSIRAVAARNAAGGFVPPPANGADARLWAAFMGPELPQRARFPPGAAVEAEMKKFQHSPDPLARLFAEKLADYFPTSRDIPAWFRPLPPAPSPSVATQQGEGGWAGWAGSAAMRHGRDAPGGDGGLEASPERDVAWQQGVAGAADSFLPPQAASLVRGIIPTLRGLRSAPHEGGSPPRGAHAGEAPEKKKEPPKPNGWTHFGRAILLAGVVLLVLYLLFFLRKTRDAWRKNASGFAPWRAVKAAASASGETASAVRRLLP